MKSFLSEYGFVILAAIAVVLLLAMTSPVGKRIENSVSGVIDSFSDRTHMKLSSLGAIETEVTLVQKDNEGNFTVNVLSDSKTDVFTAQYRVRDQFNNWTGWKDLGNLTAGGKIHTLDFKATIENGNLCQVRVHDKAQDENNYCMSSIIAYTGSESKAE